MQTGPEISLFTIIMFGLLIQFLWLILGRRGRNSYIRSITSFRKPTSTLARMYEWRLTNVRNAVFEGLVFEVFFVIILLFYVLTSFSLLDFIQVVPFIVLILGVSLVTVVQMTLRVRAILRVEKHTLESLTEADDKIGRAKLVLEDLFSKGRDGDGRLWLALFRIAQTQTPIGYAVRDVLLEKSRQLKESPRSSDVGSLSEDQGPGLA